MKTLEDLDLEKTASFLCKSIGERLNRINKIGIRPDEDDHFKTLRDLANVITEKIKMKNTPGLKPE